MIARLLKGFGHGLRNGLIAVGALAFSGGIIALADYSLTQGSGTTFASVVISTKHYVAQLICDATAGESQCAAVTSGNALKVDGSAVTQPVSAASGALASGAGVDGWNVTEGTKADSAWTSGSGSLIAIAKAIATNTGQSVPVGTNVIGFVSNDACAQAAKLGAPINLTASGRVIVGASSKKTYICSLDIISATAQNIALVEGTGSTCATNIFGLAGGTTAATGWNFAANGGLTKGGGSATVYSPSADTNATAADVCLLLSSTGQTSGQITYVQQ